MHRSGLFQDRRSAPPPGLEPAVLADVAGPAVLEPNDPRGPETEQPCAPGSVAGSDRTTRYIRNRPAMPAGVAVDREQR